MLNKRQHLCDELRRRRSMQQSGTTVHIVGQRMYMTVTGDNRTMDLSRLVVTHATVRIHNCPFCGANRKRL